MSTSSIDTELKQFVAEYVDSLISWAIIVFYHQNPGARDRASDLARHLGRREEDVLRAAERLVDKGLLRKEDATEPVYTYEADDEMRLRVAAFVGGLETRDVRLWVLETVLGK